MKRNNMDGLVSVTLKPDSDTIRTGETHNIQAIYNPKSYPVQSGKWIYDSTALSVHVESDTLLEFTPIKGGIQYVRYIPDDDQEIISSIKLMIYGKAAPFTLIPESETVNVGDDFYIRVLYDSTQGSPEWLYNEKILEKLPDSTDGKIHFKALTDTDSKGIPLVCSFNSQVKVNTCVINPSEQESTVSLNPSGTINVKIWDEYYVNIFYDPPEGSKNGSWDDDNEYLELLPDSTQDLAHFKVVKLPDDLSTPVSRTYTCGKSSAVHSCYIGYADIKSVIVTQSQKSVDVGDIVTVKIEVEPPYSKFPTGQVIFDKEYLKPLVNSDKFYQNDMPAYFKALAIKPVNSTDIVALAYLTVGATANISINDSIVDNISISPSEIEKLVYGDLSSVDGGFELNLGIIHDKEQSLCDGSWLVSDEQKIKMLPSEDTNRYETFKIEKSISEKDKSSITYLINPTGYEPTTVTCLVSTISEPIVGAYISIKDVNYASGDVFDVNVIYDPVDCVYEGEWIYDPNYLVPVSLTNTVATFTTKQINQNFVSTDISFIPQRQIDDPEYTNPIPAVKETITIYNKFYN